MAKTRTRQATSDIRSRKDIRSPGGSRTKPRSIVRFVDVFAGQTDDGTLVTLTLREVQELDAPKKEDRQKRKQYRLLVGKSFMHQIPVQFAEIFGNGSVKIHTDQGDGIFTLAMLGSQLSHPTWAGKELYPL